MVRNQPFSLVFLVLASGSIGCSSPSQNNHGVATAGSGATTAPRTPTTAGSTAVTPGTSGTGASAAGTSSPVGVGAAGSGTACPALRPVESTACTANASLVCIYDEIECKCGTGTWSCAEPVDPNCPPMMPAHGTPCSVPEGTECEFLADECECTGGRWSCESAEDAGVTEPPPTVDASTPTPAPDAGSTPCPDLRPVEGLRCTVAFRTCVYDTTHCACPEGTWLCNESVDPTCPIEPPTHGNSCEGRADCDYFNIECECRFGTWNCKAND